MSVPERRPALTPDELAQVRAMLTDDRYDLSGLSQPAADTIRLLLGAGRRLLDTIDATGVSVPAEPGAPDLDADGDPITPDPHSDDWYDGYAEANREWEQRTGISTSQPVPAPEPSAPCICTPDQFQGHGHGVNCPQYAPEPSARLREAALAYVAAQDAEVEFRRQPHHYAFGDRAAASAIDHEQQKHTVAVADAYKAFRAALAATPQDPEP